MSTPVSNQVNMDTNDLLSFDFELFLMTEVLGLRSLHYGYWPKTLPVSLKNVGKAQALYTQELLKVLPKQVKTVIDVGSGIGDVSRAMHRRGLSVTAISKDVNHRAYYDDLPHIQFHNLKFQEFVTTTKFDAMVMSESQSYFSSEYIFQRSKDLLVKDGFLLISGLFVKDGFAHPYMKGQKYRAFLQEAKNYGFKIVHQRNITKDVSPTIKLAQNYREKFEGSLHKLYQGYMNQRKNPFKRILMWLLFRQELKNIMEMYNYYTTFLDLKWFKKHVIYAHVLLQKVG